MTREKQWRLVQRLADKTRDSLLDWKLGPSDEIVQTNIGDFPLTLTRIIRNPEGGDEDYVVSIYDERGDVAEKFSDVDLYRSMENKLDDDVPSPFKVMQDLFEAARRNATGADRILDTMLRDLDALF